MAELAPDPTAALIQVRAAARAFAAGGDGIALLPSELRAATVLWLGRLQREGQVLDFEALQLGLLTLTCLSQRASWPCPSSSERACGAHPE